MGVQVALLCPEPPSFRCTPRSTITESYGSSTFSFIWKLHTAFHSGCSNIHSHQQWIKIPFLPHLLQHLLLYLLMITILTRAR
jgi:hypothetical protein